MKYLMIAMLCYATAARGQEATIPKKPAHLNLYSIPNPDIIDTATIKKLTDKFYAGIAGQDRMPVLLPYRTGKPILNAGKSINHAGRMPNLWNKPQKDSTTRDQRFYKRPLYYDVIPSLSAR